MGMLTTAELTEPDVTLVIHPDRLALDVSKELEDLLRLYGYCTMNEKGKLVFSVPAYRYRDEIEPLLHKEANDWTRERCPTLYAFLQSQIEAGTDRVEIFQQCAKLRGMTEGLLRQVDATISHLLRGHHKI